MPLSLNVTISVYTAVRGFLLKLTLSISIVVCLQLNLLADIGLAKSSAEKEFPDLKIENSLFSRAYRAEETVLRKSKPDFFNDENWPLMLAYRVAQKIGIDPASVEARQSSFTTPQNIKKALTPEELARDASQCIVIIEGDKGSGTGFIVNQGGKCFFVSNAHVIDGNSKITAATASKKLSLPEKINVSKTRDVIMAEVSETSGLELLQDIPGEAAIGDALAVVGNSSGMSVARLLKGRLLGVGNNLIETDAGFVHGNSGSPIFHLPTGKVIGVATFAQRLKRNDLMADSDLKEIRRFGYRIDNIDDLEEISLSEFLHFGFWIKAINERNDGLVTALKLYAAEKDRLYRVKAAVEGNRAFGINNQKFSDYLGLQDIPRVADLQKMTTFQKRNLRDALKIREKIIDLLEPYPHSPLLLLSVASSKNPQKWALANERVQVALKALEAMQLEE